MLIQKKGVDVCSRKRKLVIERRSVWSVRGVVGGVTGGLWGGGWLRCSVPETQLDAAESCFRRRDISSDQQGELIRPKWKQEEDEGRTHS